MSEEEAMQLGKKMIESRFDFNDFLKQSKMMKSMGNIGGVANMIPGMAGKITPRQLSGVEVNIPMQQIRRTIHRPLFRALYLYIRFSICIEGRLAWQWRKLPPS